MNESYFHLLDQISVCAKSAGRDPSSIQLIAVTKYASLEQMQQAYKLGIRHFGESRLQTALPKLKHFPSDIQWHFIGSLQSNKIGKIVEHFDYIHSVDSLEIAQLIARKSSELQKRPQIFLQVNTSKEPSKHGFSEAALLEQFGAIAALNLNIIGLMTMAPLPSDAGSAKRCFHVLKLLRDQLSLVHLSMGMTQDFLSAIEEGATFLRIGSLLFKK